MYHLLSGLYKHFNQKEEYNIIILGLDNAGKTTLLEKIKSTYSNQSTLSPDKINPTVGLNIGKIDIGHTRLNFWDLGGQKELRRIWKKYYTECHAIVFVVDSTDRERLEEVKDTFATIVSEDLVDGVPILMLGNKQDVDNSLPVQDIKEIFNPIAINLGARDSSVLGVCAITGTGITESIDWLQLRMVRNATDRPPIFRN